MKRVLVIGAGGAGKSSFARRLAESTGLPLIHLDAHYRLPGWTEPSKAAWAKIVDKLIAGECWIMDGNFGGSLERRLAACDTVVFLDMPWWLCVWRVIGRRIQHHGRARPDMTAGCRERLGPGFVVWIIGYPLRNRPGVLRRLAALSPGQQVTRLRTRAAVERFLQSTGRADSTSGPSPA